MVGKLKNKQILTDRFLRDCHGKTVPLDASLSEMMNQQIEGFDSGSE